jgi:hypothetical protein
VRNVKGGACFQNEYLGKVVRWYYSNKSHDYIQYITSGNKVADSENCKPLMDLPDNLPNDLDFDRYVQKCIDILYDIGYYYRQKQVAFF